MNCKLVLVDQLEDNNFARRSSCTAESRRELSLYCLMAQYKYISKSEHMGLSRIQPSTGSPGSN